MSGEKVMEELKNSQCSINNPSGTFSAEQYAVVWKGNRSVIIDNNDKKISHRMNE